MKLQYTLFPRPRWEREVSQPLGRQYPFLVATNMLVLILIQRGKEADPKCLKEFEAKEQVRGGPSRSDGLKVPHVPHGIASSFSLFDGTIETVRNIRC